MPHHSFHPLLLKIVYHKGHDVLLPQKRNGGSSPATTPSTPFAFTRSTQHGVGKFLRSPSGPRRGLCSRGRRRGLVGTHFFAPTWRTGRVTGEW